MILSGMVKAQAAIKAFVINEGKILILRESMDYESPNKGKWDTPGGRVEENENAEEAITREIKKETGLNIKIGKAFAVGDWYPIIQGIKIHIVGTFIECFSDSKEVKLSKDHDKYEWINAEDYKKYDLVPALPKAFEDYLNK